MSVLNIHPAVCPACDGEGYHYVEQAGRQRTHPIVEIPCPRCAGTGLLEGGAA